MRSPRGLSRIEIVQNGRAVKKSIEIRREGGVQSIALETSLRFEKSGWIAARGEGERGGVFGGNAVAHTAAIRVLVGGAPIWSESDGQALVDQIEEQKAFYAENGRYATQGDRRQVLALFDRAIGELRAKHEGGGKSDVCAQ